MPTVSKYPPETTLMNGPPPGSSGIESSPSFVRSPEGNGCAERFIRTLKEQLLWTRWFRNVEELLEALHEWVQTYNEQWMVEKHEHRSPNEIRAHLAETREAA